MAAVDTCIGFAQEWSIHNQVEEAQGTLPFMVELFAKRDEGGGVTAFCCIPTDDPIWL